MAKKRSASTAFTVKYFVVSEEELHRSEREETQKSRPPGEAKRLPRKHKSCSEEETLPMVRAYRADRLVTECA